MTPVEFAMHTDFLCCPYEDHGTLKAGDPQKLVCQACRREFPSVEGRPILFDETRCVFSTLEVLQHEDRRQFPEVKGFKFRLRQLLPVAANFDSTDYLKEALPHLPPVPVVLVIGCGLTGALLRQLLPAASLILSDVTLQGDAEFACSGECLPFRDQSFDLIVADQVLEHVVNPTSVVNEIHRCLKSGGIVFSGIPFYYPNHGLPYDFQRVTPLGHKMLYRQFRQLALHTTGGPFSCLSLALLNFFCSLWEDLWWRRLTSLLTRLLFGPFLWLDRFYRGREIGSTTICLNSVFMGVKAGVAQSPKAILGSFCSGESEAGMPTASPTT